MAGEPSNAQPIKERKAVFKAAVEEELARQEIATQIRRSGEVDAKDLRALAEQSDDELWEPAESDQQLVELFDGELRLLQQRLRIPVVRALHALVAYPYLQAAATITGLLLLASSFGSKFLPGGGASGWSRILFASGLTMLAVALVDCIAGYVSTVAARPAVPPIRPLLTTLTGLAAATFAIVEANRLVQYHTAALLALWVLVLTDTGVVALMAYRRVAAIRAEEQARKYPELDESERAWLLASRRAAARRSWGLIGGLCAIALILAWVTVNGFSAPRFPVPTPQGPSQPLPRPTWPLFYSGLAVVGISVLAAAIGGINPRLQRTLETVKADLAAAVERRDEALRASIRPFLRNRLSFSSYQMDLLDVEAPGLSEVFDPLYEVPVKATDRLQGLIDSLPGGSIGIAGPRGAGKTTLIRSFCKGSRAQADDISTIQSAPVEYSARDFVLNLFVSLCYEVLGQTEDSQLTAQPTEPLPTGFRSVPRLVLLGGLCFVLGGLLLFGLFVQDIRIDPRLAWGLVLVWGGLFLVYVAMPSLFRRPPPVAGDGDEQRALLRTAAARRLQELRFQQTISSSWTGAAKTPVGLEATVSRGSTLARIQLSFPELVTMLRQFMEFVAGHSRLIIGIDELDKLPSDETARQFLNEVKAIFGVRGCYYLISISEEAMASFDRRGLPFRDVFDSSFDDVVNVSFLRLTDAKRLLNRRVVLPIPFTCLCYCLSGGLARDLIRAARNVVEAQPRLAQEQRVPLRIDEAARRLVGEEVRLKTAATVATLRALELEPEVSEVVQWCSRTQSGDAVSPRALLDQCRWCIDDGSFRPGHSGDSEELLQERQMLFRLTRELCGFYYYAASVLEFFHADLSEEQARKVTDPGAGDQSIDLLATSRQAFAVNPRLAWDTVSTFCQAWDLVSLPFPVRLLWARGAPERSTHA